MIHKTSPIVLFVFNRPWHTRQTIEALHNNALASQSDLIIFSDGVRDDRDLSPVFEVRNYVRSIKGFRSLEIVEKPENQGLANSIINGVSSVIDRYGRAIVLEDDIVTSPYFLGYMNAALDFYEETERVFTICGYNHPPELLKIPRHYTHDVFFTYRNSSWGWATWKNRWLKADWQVSDYSSFKGSVAARKSFDRSGSDLSDMLIAQMEGQIDSWAIRWTYSHFVHNSLALWPIRSFVNNIGHDNTGIHSRRTTIYCNDLSRTKKDPKLPPVPFVDEQLLKNFARVYKRGPLTRFKKFLVGMGNK